MKPKLQDQVRALLDKSGMDNREIAAIAQTSKQWVYLFRSGQIKSPNVDTIEALYIHLTGQPIIKEDRT